MWPGLRMGVCWPAAVRPKSGSSNPGRAGNALDDHSLGIERLAWSPDGQRLAVAAWDQTLRIYALPDFRQTFPPARHDNNVVDVSWSPDGMLLASSSSDQRVGLWNPETGGSAGWCEGHTDGVLFLAWSPDGRLLASASEDCTARIWDARAGCGLVHSVEHPSPVRGVTWLPDGDQIISASSGGEVWISDVHSGRIRKRHQLPVGDYLTEFVWSADRSRVAAKGVDKTFWISCAAPTL